MSIEILILGLTMEAETENLRGYTASTSLIYIVLQVPWTALCLILRIKCRTKKKVWISDLIANKLNRTVL